MPIFNRSQLRHIFTELGPHVGDDLADVLEAGTHDLATKEDIAEQTKNFERALTKLEERFHAQLAAMEDRFNEKLAAMEDRFNEKIANLQMQVNERMARQEDHLEARFYRAMLALAVFFIALYGGTVGFFVAWG